LWADGILIPNLHKALFVSGYYLTAFDTKEMTTLEIEKSLYEFIRPKYPNIIIKVKDSVENIRQLYFIDDKFKDLYPQQRYHYLIHLIPADFFEQNLKETHWFELAPNETPENLDYHDKATIDEIKEPIFYVLRDKVNFVSILDGKFSSQSVECHGDFRHSKNILTSLGFSTEEQFDIFHVLMDEGGYCDCEILFNVFRESEYAKQYWQTRQ
jgi:Protein of unknown function (DUF2695)